MISPHSGIMGQELANLVRADEKQKYKLILARI